MKDFIRGAWKALAGGLYAAAASAGVVVADLDWRAIIGAFVVGVLGVYFSPSNKTATTTPEREPL